nr:unnamed protein product [Digitaria exilis]
MASPLYPGKNELMIAVAAMLVLQLGTATDGGIGKDGCQDKCGNVSIPYPFGIGPEVCFREGFEVNCGPDNVAILVNSSMIPLLDVNLDLSEARVQNNAIARLCKYTLENGTEQRDWTTTNFDVGPSFMVSGAKNKFTAIGCATVASIMIGPNYGKESFVTCACGSFCYREDFIDNQTECFGRGCCQSAIPPESLNSFYPSILFTIDNTGVQSFSPCSYAFIAEEGSFEFNPSYATSTSFDTTHGHPLVLSWIVGEGTCVEAKNGSSYACVSTNITCSDVPDRGYRCNCSEGYHGNPYLVGGCQDIDECKILPHPCKGGECTNTNGDYTRTCPRGTHSEDPKTIPCTETNNGPNKLIHGNHGSRPPISLEARLKIAQESAEALSYLHLSTNRPIVHGDVKSLNILLDENYMAKVTDFGASRILPKDAVQLMTMVQGTLGYLDPEYLQEQKLTEKSDVYSFGVVLLELITRRMAISFEGPAEEKSLVSSSLKALKGNRVKYMLHSSIMGVEMEELFQKVVTLASMCLSSKGEDRPSMTQVADNLKAIRSTWREVLLLQHKEITEHIAEGLAASSTCDLSPSMYWTVKIMGLDIEGTPQDNVGTTHIWRIGILDLRSRV